MRTFNEDARVKIPATIQFMHIGYRYRSLKDINIEKNARIAAYESRFNAYKIKREAGTDIA